VRNAGQAHNAVTELPDGQTRWSWHHTDCTYYKNLGMWKLAALSIAIVLGGCGTDSGTKVDSSQLTKFTVGQTTYDQVTASLGRPSTLQTRSDGSRTAAYSHLSASPRAATFIPIVGAFAGGADVHSETVVFQFDRRGVLTDYTTSQTQACSGTGVFSDVNAANCDKR
jgi:outer membrane protein assembly factor BamE (lipoprotein component of BamABCDE complex)